MTIPECSRTLRVPAFTTAHSHAFQRALRGKAQRPGPLAQDDFWTWREAMYTLVEGLTPDSVEAIARVAYRELHASGVRTVGEFHYVHHAPNGVPYDDGNELAHRVIRAALDSGLRISLLRSIYQRGGHGRGLAKAQERFADKSLDASLRAISDLQSYYVNNPLVRIGIAPHSTRAVHPAAWKEIVAFAQGRDLPFHVHVAEQPRELDECLHETGMRPLQLLEDRGAISPRLVVVHGTHLLPEESEILGKSQGFVCMCATTERDLGDGLPNLGAMRAAGVRLCMGIDSHVVCDPFDDMRALETHERLRTGRRVAARVAHPAASLWASASTEGAKACGFDGDGPSLTVRTDAPFFAFVDSGDELDALVFSGTRALDGLFA